MINIYNSLTDFLEKNKRWPCIVFAFLLIIYPYIFAVNALFPIAGFLGKNAYIQLITFFILCLFVINSKQQLKYNYLYIILLLMFFLSITIVVGRVVLYREDFLLLAVNNRSPILFIIYMLLACCFVKTSNDKNFFSKIILINCIVQALLGIIHYYYFPYIVTGSEFVSPGLTYEIVDPAKVYGRAFGFREGGSLISSSLYADFILLGLFVLLYFRKNIISNKYMSYLAIAAIAIMFWGIILSGSRYSVGVGFLVIFLYFLENFSFKRVLLFAILIGLIGFCTSAVFVHIFERVNDAGSNVRMLKNLLAIHMLTDNIGYFLMGVPNKVILMTMTSSGLLFSDNSFLTIALNYGVPYLIIWLAVITFLFKTMLGFKNNLLIIGYFIGVLFFTNGIYWDIWVLYSCVTFFAVKDNYAN